MEEVETLKRDKNVLMMELVHLRQKQSVGLLGYLLALTQIQPSSSPACESACLACNRLRCTIMPKSSILARTRSSQMCPRRPFGGVLLIEQQAFYAGICCVAMASRILQLQALHQCCLIEAIGLRGAGI